MNDLCKESGSDSCNRWEVGSEYEWPLNAHWLRPGARSTGVFPEPNLLRGSGHEAILTALRSASADRPIHRLLVPSYYCQTVIDTLRFDGIKVERYHGGPFDNQLDLNGKEIKEGDAVLVVNYFGLNHNFPGEEAVEGAVIIEDHTHDPLSQWAQSSVAHFCIASLRKTMPIPDGGIVWSPKRYSLLGGSSCTNQHQEAVGSKLASALMKSMYLKGQLSDKTAFRTLAVNAERILSFGKYSSGISEFSRDILPFMPVRQMREERKRNWQYLFEYLSNKEWVRVMAPESEHAVSCAAMVVFETESMRNDFCNYLIKYNVFPVVLWDQSNPSSVASGQIPAKHRSLGERILGIPCDFRYSLEDMEKICSIISSFKSGI